MNSCQSLGLISYWFWCTASSTDQAMGEIRKIYYCDFYYTSGAIDQLRDTGVSAPVFIDAALGGQIGFGADTPRRTTGLYSTNRYSVILSLVVRYCCSSTTSYHLYVLKYSLLIMTRTKSSALLPNTIVRIMHSTCVFVSLITCAGLHTH